MQLFGGISPQYIVIIRLEKSRPSSQVGRRLHVERNFGRRVYHPHAAN